MYAHQGRAIIFYFSFSKLINGQPNRLSIRPTKREQSPLQPRPFEISVPLHASWWKTAPNQRGIKCTHPWTKSSTPTKN